MLIVRMCDKPLHFEQSYQDKEIIYLKWWKISTFEASTIFCWNLATPFKLIDPMTKKKDFPQISKRWQRQFKKANHRSTNIDSDFKISKQQIPIRFVWFKCIEFENMEFEIRFWIKSLKPQNVLLHLEDFQSQLLKYNQQRPSKIYFNC